jgi:hypothetical protein
MLASAPNWAEQLTAVATAVGAVGLLAAIGAAFFAGAQVREARQARQTQLAGDLFRRWSEPDLVETRRLVASFETPEELRDALLRHVKDNAVEAYVLFREPDFFEQLGALDARGAFDFELIRILLGHRLIDRWNLWRPAIAALGPDVYPQFEQLVERMRRRLASQ